jgi:hypothetical protein
MDIAMTFEDADKEHMKTLVAQWSQQFQTETRNVDEVFFKLAEFYVNIKYYIILYIFLH